jgi:hypothetical protein
MYQSTSHKIWIFFLYLVSKYVVWITIGVILILYYFFPEVIDVFGKIVLLWGPIIVLVAGLIIIMTTHAFRFKKHGEQGITQYEILVGKYEIYLSDLLIYVGTIIILISAHLFSADGVGVTDLIQTLIFFVFATWIKQIYYRKIIQ